MELLVSFTREILAQQRVVGDEENRKKFQFISLLCQMLCAWKMFYEPTTKTSKIFYFPLYVSVFVPTRGIGGCLSGLSGSSITNGGYENSINDNHAIMNRSAATASPQSTGHHRATARIMTVTSKTTNYDNNPPDGSGTTQTTIISEPYFDSQTPRNVTGLVGKQEKNWLNKFEYSRLIATHWSELDGMREFCGPHGARVRGWAITGKNQYRVWHDVEAALWARTW